MSPDEKHNIVSYITLSEATGGRLTPGRLRDYMGRLSWEKTFLSLAVLAGSLANIRYDKGENFASRIRTSLERQRFHLDPDMKRIGDVVAANPTRPIAHEQVIYFLQAMAILHGRADGPEPTNEQLGFLLLAANDHLRYWKEDDSPRLPELEALVAEFCHVSRFNHHRDPIRSLVRAARIFDRKPQEGIFADEVKWADLQRRAFGCSFVEYFESFVMPLFMVSQMWGVASANGTFEGPIIMPEQWFSQTKLAPDWASRQLQPLSISREDAQAELRKSLRENGLPHAPVLFVRTPFLKNAAGALLGSSPWAVREQLRGGLWMRLMKASEKFTKRTEGWTGTFGYLFELACHEVALAAQGEPRFAGRVEVSKKPGTNELEDVVIYEGNAVILFSAKSRLVKEAVARQSVSRRALVNWYDDFLFGAKTKTHRPGALRLLDTRVRAIRRGDVPAAPADAQIYPVLITFDELGENGALYRWAEKRCREMGILQPPNVSPVTFLTLDGFEALLSLAAHGHPVASVLQQKTAAPWANATSDALFYNYSPDGSLLRLKVLQERFDFYADRSHERIFGFKPTPVLMKSAEQPELPVLSETK